jgi:hypothetical protein
VVPVPVAVAVPALALALALAIAIAVPIAMTAGSRCRSRVVRDVVPVSSPVSSPPPASCSRRCRDSGRFLPCRHHCRPAAVAALPPWPPLPPLPPATVIGVLVPAGHHVVADPRETWPPVVIPEREGDCARLGRPPKRTKSSLAKQTSTRRSVAVWYRGSAPRSVRRLRAVVHETRLFRSMLLCAHDLELEAVVASGPQASSSYAREPA